MKETELLRTLLGDRGAAAEQLLAVGGLDGLARRTPCELELLSGHSLGEGAERLAAAFQLARCLAVSNREERPRFRGGADVFTRFAIRFRGLRKERFYALYLDGKGSLLHEERVSEGTLTSSLVHPREVFAPALLHRAAAVIVTHNHPSGDPEPSAEDRATTRRLLRAGRLLGVDLLDHVVIGDGRYSSFLELGWL